MPQPQNMQITPEQVQMAAAAGLQILNDRDLKVPVAVAKNGSVGILESILLALNSGNVVLASPENVIPPTDPDGGEPAPDPAGSNPEGPKLVSGVEAKAEDAAPTEERKETEGVN